MKAVDVDSGKNGKLSYHFKVNNSNVQSTHGFFIHPNTGEIICEKDFRFDIQKKYEVSKAYIIWFNK